MSERRPDYASREFWVWATGACGASPLYLATWFPGVGYKAWRSRKRAAQDTHGIEFPELPRDPFLKDKIPPDPPPGWPELSEADTSAAEKERAKASVDLTTEERIEADARIRRLRAEMADLKSKYEEAHAESDLESRFIAAIESRTSAMPAVPPPTFRPRSPGRPESVVALVSDAHIGEVVDYEETGGLNHYDFDTFCRRWQYHTDAVGGICFGKLTGYDFPELVICALGDMVSGIIHDELVETSDGTLMDWLIDGSHVIAQGIRQLAAEFPAVRVEWHFGNHGRVTQKPRFKHRWVNYDFLLGYMVSVELKEQANVTFTNHKSFWSLTDVQGHHLLNLHGDQIRGWAGIPAYGINRAVSNLTALLNSQRKTFDVVNLGHFHQTGLLERVDCDVVLNGSMIGGNEYSYGALFAGSKPRQILYGVHPERGRTWQYAIDLSNGDGHDVRFAR